MVGKCSISAVATLVTEAPVLLLHRHQCLHFCGEAHRGTRLAPNHEAAEHPSRHQGVQHFAERLQQERGGVSNPWHPSGNGRCVSEALCCDLQHPD